MPTQQEIQAAIDRLTAGYYNSRAKSGSNPGGMAADGHEENFPAALTDAGIVAEFAGGRAARASAWAVKLDALVDGTDSSAKAYAIGLDSQMPGAGSAKAWATATGTVADSMKGARGYAGDASASADDAATSASSAADSASAAASSAGTAADHVTQARLWAEEDEDVEVTSGAHSALHHAAKAADSAQSAANSSGIPASGSEDTGRALSVRADGTADWRGIPRRALAYDQRGALRSLGDLIDGDVALVESLGLFVFRQGSSEPDDDETALRADDGSGAWLLAVVHWDAIYAYLLPELDLLWRYLASRVLHGAVDVTISSVGSTSSASVTATIHGARTGDRVIATPPGQLGSGRLGYHARVSADDEVTLTVTNPSASSDYLGGAEGLWALTVIQEVS